MHTVRPNLPDPMGIMRSARRYEPASQGGYARRLLKRTKRGGAVETCGAVFPRSSKSSVSCRTITDWQLRGGIILHHLTEDYPPAFFRTTIECKK